MQPRHIAARPIMAATLLACGIAHAQPAPPDIAKQKAAISRLDEFNGIWRGTATILKPGSPPLHRIQTERVGASLGGTVKLIAGRSYNDDGTPSEFSALAIISFDDATGAYAFDAYAQGRAGNFPLMVTPDGFEWSRGAGPGAAIQYRASVKAGIWHEEGQYERGGKPVAKVFEMTLQRLGASDWPDSGAVPPKE